MSELMRIRKRELPPPGDFRFTFRQDGYLARSTSYYSWMADIERHYRDNGYEKPDDWREQAEHQCCLLMPAGYCRFPDGGEPDFFVSARIGVADIIRGTQVLGRWIGSGFPLVERSVAEERGRICSGCYANVQVSGCGACHALANHVAAVVGVEKVLSSDAQLEGKSCAYCHCVSRANVWVPVEISKAGVTQEALEHMPEWCWKKTGIALLTENA